LADGTAGWVVRLVVSIAAAALTAGACLVFSFLLALFVPEFNRLRYWPRAVSPTDELLLVVSVFGGSCYLAGLGWLWTRRRRGRAPSQVILYATLLTFALVVVTSLLGIYIDNALAGDEEIAIVGIVMMAGAAAIVIWLVAIRRYNAGHGLQTAQEQQQEIRCPNCGYRMVGLHESRCPECGTLYTLDELLAKQEFVARSAPAAAREAVAE
jgi:hypothetical protein